MSYVALHCRVMAGHSALFVLYTPDPCPPATPASSQVLRAATVLPLKAIRSAQTTSSPSASVSYSSPTIPWSELRRDDFVRGKVQVRRSYENAAIQCVTL